MSMLSIRVRMVIFKADGPISVPFEHSRKGSWVGDVFSPGGELLGGQTGTTNMEIGGVLTRMIAAGQLNFSRARDGFSVDISEAAQSSIPVICVLEFVTLDGDSKDTATLVIQANKIEGYISHTKRRNFAGNMERIGLNFGPQGTVLRFGHISMALLRTIRHKYFQGAKENAAGGGEISVGQNIVGVIGNIRNLF